MARKKNELTPVPKDTRKDPNCVKNGCSSCVDKDTDLSKLPCKDCGPGKNWLYWRDAKAEKEKTQ